MEGNYKKWLNRINSKQDILTEDNVGQFMDLELDTKSTPTSGDTVLGRDSLTGKAVEIPTSSFGGSGSVDTSNLVPYTGANKDVNIGAYYFESSLGFKITGGTPNQFLMADGSVDNNVYATTTSLNNYVTLDTTQTINSAKTFVGNTSIQSRLAVQDSTGGEFFVVNAGLYRGVIKNPDGGTEATLFGWNKTSIHGNNNLVFQLPVPTAMLRVRTNYNDYLDSALAVEGNSYLQTISTKTHGTSADWKQAYDDKINSVTFTSSTLTLTQQDSGVVSVSVPTFNQNTTGNAATATKLQTARKINGVSFDGSADITINAGINYTDGTNISISGNQISVVSAPTFTGSVTANGFKTPTGTDTQALTADGGVFDLTTKADLVSGKIPASQLPSYVDDVLEYANLASFPATGESGKIYIAIDTNLTYRWGGSSYVVMSSSLALGETSSTAYRGDRGEIAYTHSQATGNPHDTKLEELSDVSGTDTMIIDDDVILKKESGGFWKKITFANFKNWFTTELAKKINIGLDTVFNFKDISAMTLTEFRSITPNIETIYFTEEQNGTGWQQIKYNGLGISIPATTETLVSLTNENFIELDSDSTFNLIDVANTKINGIFEKDFVIIKFNAGVVTPATANQWFKVILKINGVQTAVSPAFYLTESSGTVEQIAHNFALNVPANMLTNGATLHLKTSTSMTFNNPAISVVRVHKSTNANL